MTLGQQSDSDVDGYLDSLNVSSTERGLFKALLPFCDERLNVTGDAVAAVLTVLAPVLEQANTAAIYAQTACSCPRYGSEMGFAEDCVVHGNVA